MRIFGRNWNILHTRKALPAEDLFILTFGFLAGIILTNLCKKYILEDTTILDAYSLSLLRNMTIDYDDFFVFALGQRILPIVVLAILCTTYLGTVVCSAVAGILGIELGVFLSILTMRYGIKGQVLALVWLFPQYVLYFPMVFLLIGWGKKMSRNIYRSSRISNDQVISRRRKILETVGKILVVSFLLVMGCMLESYVNPVILKVYLKDF